MNKKIRGALISVFYKDGLEPIVQLLSELGITIYTTGGTQEFIQKLGIKVIPVETVTSYPSILGGRVKTLHPSVFGGILGRRDTESDVQEMKHYNIPEIDLVIVDLYPFEETVLKYKTSGDDRGEGAIIEKIDIGGPSMIRGAAKNFKDVLVVAAKRDYSRLVQVLQDQKGESTLEQRRAFAAKAFEIIANYDVAIAKYFNQPARQTDSSEALFFLESVHNPISMRYGENPHQHAIFYGDLEKVFTQLHGKELSYNNLVDIDSAIQLINEFQPPAPGKSKPGEATFAIIKHTNVCGIAKKNSVKEAWDAALTADPESAFGGVLVCNQAIDKATADAINSIFFEVLIAPSYTEDALDVLKTKKNRILLQQKESLFNPMQYKSILNGVLMQQRDEGNYMQWNEVGGRESSPEEKTDLVFANIICKHLKSNAIALVKDSQLVGKGCGQTSRIDSLRQAIEKSKQFNFNLKGAVMASDAFFPFNDCVKMGNEEGITAFIQPGGSIRDKDSIEYCKENNLAMVMTGLRHFKH